VRVFAHGLTVVVHNVRVSDDDNADDHTGGAADPAPVVAGKRRADVPVDHDPAAAESAPENGSPSVTRRITYWVGIGMILAGLGLLGYVAWQFWGTNWVSHRQQRQITSQLHKDWSQGQGCVKNCPTGEATALIRIPKFGQDYVVPVMEGVSPDVLAKGFGHFKDSADPGEIGNYALAGHRVTHGEPLRRMPELRPGDKVIVETRTVTYTYVLDTDPNDLIVSFSNVWVVDPLPKNPRAGGTQPDQVQGQRLITLTTCSEIFHTDNRMISFGHLVGTKPKTTPARG
jgi:sortase A